MKIDSTVIPGPKFLGHCECGIYWGLHLPYPDVGVGDVVAYRGKFYKVTKVVSVEHTCETQQGAWITSWEVTIKELRGKNRRSVRRQQAKVRPWYLLEHQNLLIKQ